jgi:hypothetical protein
MWTGSTLCDDTYLSFAIAVPFCTGEPLKYCTTPARAIIHLPQHRFVAAN